MGEARRRLVATGKKFRPKPEPELSLATTPPRSPEEVEAAQRREDTFYASIAASIDFLYQASEDAFRQQRGRSLELK